MKIDLIEFDGEIVVIDFSEFAHFIVKVNVILNDILQVEKIEYMDKNYNPMQHVPQSLIDLVDENLQVWIENNQSILKPESEDFSEWGEEDQVRYEQSNDWERSRF